MHYSHLGPLFGLPPSTLSRTLEKAEKALTLVLKELPEGRFLWPTFEEQREWADLINQKEHLVHRLWGFIDGKNYVVQKPSMADMQNWLAA